MIMKTKNYICPLIEVAIVTENLMGPSTTSNPNQEKPGGGVMDPDSAPARRLYV